MEQKVTSAVIPAAGRGNRMYPLTKSVPKELLPLVDKPAILTVMEEGIRAGVEKFYVVTSPLKPALRDFFTSDSHGNQPDSPNIPIPKVDFVTQNEPRGLGHAVLQAKTAIGDSPFVVQLPDDIFHDEDPLLRIMLQTHECTGGCVVGLMKVSPDEVGAYSTTAVEPVQLSPEVACNHDVFRLSQIVEKPLPEQVHSPYAIMGRYVLSPKIFEVLEHTNPGRNGEIQLTDALATMANIPPAEGGGVWGVVSKGRHFDTGNLAGYLRAQAVLSLEHPFLGKLLKEHLHTMICGDHVEADSYSKKPSLKGKSRCAL